MAIKTPVDGLVSPYDLSSDDGYVWLKGNLHSHTTNSDGKPAPQERLDGYVEHGYDFLCLSDHYKITRTDTVSCPDNFVLIQGAELHPANPFGGQVHHFVALNNLGRHAARGSTSRSIFLRRLRSATSRS